MKTSTNFGCLAVVMTLSSLLGCTKVADTDPHVAQRTSPALTPNGSQPMTPASRSRSAAEQIAEARCERELTCGNIGQDKTYATAQGCRARVAGDWKEELNARQCPGGINQHELNECLAQIREEACANPFDTLARITECTSAQICIEQP